MQRWPAQQAAGSAGAGLRGQTPRATGSVLGRATGKAAGETAGKAAGEAAGKAGGEVRA